MVEMHLLSVNVDFSYNPYLYSGVVTSFEQFGKAYQQNGIKINFNTLCQAVEDDPQRYRQDANDWEHWLKKLTTKRLIAWLSGTSLEWK